MLCNKNKKKIVQFRFRDDAGDAGGTDKLISRYQRAARRWASSPPSNFISASKFHEMLYENYSNFVLLSPLYHWKIMKTRRKRCNNKKRQNNVPVKLSEKRARLDDDQQDADSEEPNINDYLPDEVSKTCGRKFSDTASLLSLDQFWSHFFRYWQRFLAIFVYMSAKWQGSYVRTGSDFSTLLGFYAPKNSSAEASTVSIKSLHFCRIRSGSFWM